MQYRIRTLLVLLILLTIVAFFVLVIQGIRNFDGPFATVLVSDDHALELTNELAISLSESALRNIDVEPIRPIPSYGPAEAMHSVGRNVGDSDRITIVWEIRGQQYSDCTVRLNRSENGITASIYKNWLHSGCRRVCNRQW